MAKVSRGKKNKARIYREALTVAIHLARNPLLIGDLTELRDRLDSGMLVWRQGQPCLPNKLNPDIS